MGERGIFDEIGDALAGMRTALIDEGWFGRRAPNAPGRDLGREWGGPSIHDTPGDLPRGLSFEEGWAARAPGEPPVAPHDQDIGIDR